VDLFAGLVVGLVTVLAIFLGAQRAIYHDRQS
jgi:hypothetical protein